MTSRWTHTSSLAESGRVPLGSSRPHGLKTLLPLQTTISGNRIPMWPFSIRWYFLIPPPRFTLERSWNLLAQKPLPLLLRAAVESCVQLSSTATAVSSSPRWGKAWTLCKSTPSRRRRWQKARAARRRILSSGCSRRWQLCARVPGKPKDHRYLSAVGGVENKPLGRYHSKKKKDYTALNAQNAFFLFCCISRQPLHRIRLLRSCRRRISCSAQRPLWFASTCRCGPSAWWRHSASHRILCLNRCAEGPSC